MIRGAQNIEMKVMPKKNTIFKANEAKLINAGDKSVTANSNHSVKLELKE